MKEKILKAWVKLTEVFRDGLDKLSKKMSASELPTKIALVGLGVVLGLVFVALFCAFILFMICAAGIFLGTLGWLAWTYFGLGATYFPGLSAQWQTIPWFHFVAGMTVVTWLVRFVRPKSRTIKQGPVNVVNNGR